VGLSALHCALCERLVHPAQGRAPDGTKRLTEPIAECPFAWFRAFGMRSDSLRVRSIALHIARRRPPGPRGLRPPARSGTTRQSARAPPVVLTPRRWASIAHTPTRAGSVREQMPRAHSGAMHLSADPLELLDHAPPARGRFQRDLQTRSPGTAQGLPQPTRSAGATRALEILAGDRVGSLVRDLRPMLIQAHHDRHQSTSHPDHATSTSTRMPAAAPVAHRNREPRSVPPIRMAGRAAGSRSLT
jgi:hypothetical protein